MSEPLSPSDESAATASMPSESIGSNVGVYRLLQKLGEGGMGIVYLAEQSHPVSRRVALKVIKPGMDSRDVVARFEVERQALAMMDHPNIARVLDMGTTASGLPFFVMELVKGIPVTRFCDERRLTTKQRLELFLPICQAVQHAHQKGIIHRDIKPSNVLIAQYDDQPVPKIIDFGVAKATSQRLTENSMFTQFGQIVGTIDYMSPEQATFNQLDVDTRTDIYSLGVLLYELLTGETPFDGKRLRAVAFGELLRIIQQEEPPRPSVRLSSCETLPAAAANRSTEPRKLSLTLHGELDWIVMKALEKDRSRRYETANGLALDVRRYLDDEPVVACPPSVTYRLRKTVRRNRAAFAMIVTVFSALVLGIIGTAWQAIRATEAERRARDEQSQANAQSERATQAEALALARYENEQKQRERAEKAEADARNEAERVRIEAAVSQSIIDFITSDLLSQANPDVEPDRDITLRKVLDRAAEKIDDGMEHQPLVQAAIHHTLAVTYMSLGEYEKSELHGRRAVEIRRLHLGPENRATLISSFTVARAVYRQERLEESETLSRELLATCQQALSRDDNVSLLAQDALAATLHRRGLLRDAESHYREVLHGLGRVTGREKDGDVAIIKHNLAIALGDMGRTSEATSLHRDALEMSERLFGKTSLTTADCMFWYARTLSGMQKIPAAVQLHERAYAIRKVVLPPDHPSIADSMVALITGYRAAGRERDAARLYEELINTPSDSARFRTRRGRLLAELGQWKGAAEEMSRVDRFIEDDRKLANGPRVRMQFAVLLLATGQAAQHRECSRVVAERWSQTDPEHTLWLATMNPDPALGAEESLKLASSSLERADWAWTRFLAATAYYRVGQYERALEELVRSGIGGEFARYAEFWIAMAQHKVGQASAARQSLESAEAGYCALCIQCLTSPTVAAAHQGQWWFVAYTQIMRREAWMMITGGDPPDDAGQRAIEATFDEFSAARQEFVRTLDARPDLASLYVHRMVAIDLARKRWDEAAAALDRLGAMIAVGGEPPGRRLQQALAFESNGAFEQAADQFAGLLAQMPASERGLLTPVYEHIASSDPVFEGVSALCPKDQSLWTIRGEVAAKSRRWPAASQAYTRASELDPGDHLKWYMLSVACLEAGDVDGYRRASREMLTRFADARDPMIWERTAKTCLLLPAEGDDLELPQQLANRAVVQAPNEWLRQWSRIAQALGEFRRSRFVDAARHAGECLARETDPVYMNAMALLVQAMAQDGLRQTGEARESLGKSRALMHLMPPIETGPLDDWWHEWVRYHHLRREAERLIDRKHE